MAKRFRTEEGIILDEPFQYRKVCPDCANHEQLSIDEVNRIARDCHGSEVDCKNLFVNENGEAIAQCQCYSYEHNLCEMCFHQTEEDKKCALTSCHFLEATEAMR